MGFNCMEMIVDEPEKKTSYNKLYNKIIDISDNIGNLIYEEKNINELKSKVYSYIKPKPTQSQSDNRKLVDVINSSIKKEKEYRRLMGMSVLSIIVLSIISILLYIVYYIFSLLFDMVEWWLLAIIFISIIVPIFTAIAYFIAKGDY